MVISSTIEHISLKDVAMEPVCSLQSHFGIRYCPCFVGEIYAYEIP